MAHDRIVAICDACVLYPFHLRNIIVQAGYDGLLDVRWTEQIHEEWARNVLTDIPALCLHPGQFPEILATALNRRFAGGRQSGFLTPCRVIIQCEQHLSDANVRVHFPLIDHLGKHGPKLCRNGSALVISDGTLHYRGGSPYELPPDQPLSHAAGGMFRLTDTGTACVAQP